MRSDHGLPVACQGGQCVAEEVSEGGGREGREGGQAPCDLPSHNYIGHNYIGHNYIGAIFQEADKDGSGFLDLEELLRLGQAAMAYVIMAYVGMAYMAMARIAIAYIVMASGSARPRRRT